jgi:alpha-ketoglutarate-dependent taurine dioxygenase
MKSHSTELAQRGWTVLSDIVTDDAAATALAEFGDLIPQYDGELRNQVVAEKGNAKRRYSRSTNAIPFHTEVPCRASVPRYLALHCRRQAACGGGHTDLLDMRPFLAGLDPGLRAVAYQHGVFWIDRNAGPGLPEGVRRPMVERTADAREIVRVRYLLLSTGKYAPPLASLAAEEPFGPAREALLQAFDRFQAAHEVPVLLPEHSILLWDNWRLAHARRAYEDPERHLTRYWLGPTPAA